MRRFLTTLVLAGALASPVFAADATGTVKVDDPAHGSTEPAAGVSPPASKTVVPEITPDKKPNMETVNPSDASTGAGSGTSGANAPASDPAKPQQ